MTIPEDIKRKIKDKAIEYSKENTPQQVTLPAYHDGAFFGYSLAQSEIESKEKEIAILYKKVNDLEFENQRLKGLIEKLCESSMPEIDCIKFKKENNIT